MRGLKRQGGASPAPTIREIGLPRPCRVGAGLAPPWKGRAQFLKMFKQKILSYFGDRDLSLFSYKNDPFVELSARLLAFSVGGSVRSISWGLICVSFQLAGITHFSFQLLQRDTVFLQQVD